MIKSINEFKLSESYNVNDRIQKLLNKGYSTDSAAEKKLFINKAVQLMKQYNINKVRYLNKSKWEEFDLLLYLRNNKIEGKKKNNISDIKIGKTYLIDWDGRSSVIITNIIGNQVYFERLLDHQQNILSIEEFYNDILLIL